MNKVLLLQAVGFPHCGEDGKCIEYAASQLSDEAAIRIALSARQAAERDLARWKKLNTASVRGMFEAWNQIALLKHAIEPDTPESAVMPFWLQVLQGLFCFKVPDEDHLPRRRFRRVAA